MQHSKDDDAYSEGEKDGNEAVAVPVLPVARDLCFRRLDVAVRRIGTIRVPAKREARAQRDEYQSKGGRTHLKCLSPEYRPSAII
jgi:hypothetical protein